MLAIQLDENIRKEEEHVETNEFITMAFKEEKIRLQSLDFVVCSTTEFVIKPYE